MNLSGVDLNLMLVLEALLQEQNVSRAAERIGRSQPAVSSSLSRLRELFRDPLFVRTAAGMTPTPRAEELRPLIQSALEQFRIALDDQRFDPATSRRHFVIASADASTVHFLPRFLPALRTEAPNVTVSIIQAWGNEAVSALMRGQVDFGIGVFGQNRETFASQRLVTTREVCVGDANNSALRMLPLTLEAFLGLPKVALEREDSGNVMDPMLLTAGYTSNVVLSLPQFLGAAHTVLGTDLVAVLPAAMIDSLPDRHLFAVAPLPLAMPDIVVRLIWDERFGMDAAHVWFRNLIMRYFVTATPAQA